MHPNTTSPLAQRVAVLCEAYDSTGDRAFITHALKLLQDEVDSAPRFAAPAVERDRRRDPVALRRGDRAQRFYAVYGGEGAQEAADARDALAAARMRRERLAVDEISAFRAPLVIDSKGRAL
jgi:hypothetical protein